MLRRPIIANRMILSIEKCHTYGFIISQIQLETRVLSVILFSQMHPTHRRPSACRVSFWFCLYFDRTLYHDEHMLDRRCSDVTEAQQWTLGECVMIDSYKQYLQQARKTSSEKVSLTFTPVTRGQKDRRHRGTSQIEVIQKWSRL